MERKTGSAKSFVRDSAAWHDNCHLEIYGSVRPKSVFERMLELITLEKWSWNRSNYNGVTIAKILVQILWFSSLSSFPALVAGGWEMCTVRRGKGAEEKPTHQPGTAYRSSSMWLAPDLAHCSCPGAWLLPHPMGPQDLGYLAVGWWFVILVGDRGAGSRADFRDRLFFLGKWWELFCAFFWGFLWVFSSWLLQAC